MRRTTVEDFWGELRATGCYLTHEECLPEKRASNGARATFSLAWNVSKVFRVSPFYQLFGKLTRKSLAELSFASIAGAESLGIKVELSGWDNRAVYDGPVIYLSNHLSMMETIMIPATILAFGPYDVIVKESIARLPFLTRRIRDWMGLVAIGRKDPRADLAKVLGVGGERLREGRSMLIFPQGTRRFVFRRDEFSSIGARLAARTGCPICPIAVDTRCMPTRDAGVFGGVFHDFGPVDTSRRIRCACGPLIPPGKPRETSDAAFDWIVGKLAEWGMPVVRRILCAVLLSCTAFASFGAPGDGDGVDRHDPNFVTASLVVAAPGSVLFSCAGHAFLRLECPHYNLDYCFSYESESIPDRIFSFFAGRLKMGLFAVPTSEFFRQYETESRGIVQYRLNLTPEAKQRLWKILDDKAAEGANLPYDYLKRGCAWSVLGCLRTAILPDTMEVSSWPDKYEKTRREIAAMAIADYRWNLFALHAIWGAETDREVTKIEKVLIPADLLAFLRRATINGGPFISGEGEVVKPLAAGTPNSVFTPLVMASLFVLLALANGFFRWRYLDWGFLAVQSLAGAFFTYMVYCSSLTATDWNWLIVPFNLLPLILWRWRRYWAWGFVAVLLAWEAFMLLSPHQLTDPAYLVTVLAYVVFYAKVAMRERRNML